MEDEKSTKWLNAFILILLFLIVIKLFVSILNTYGPYAVNSFIFEKLLPYVEYIIIPYTLYVITHIWNTLKVFKQKNFYKIPKEIFLIFIIGIIIILIL